MSATDIPTRPEYKSPLKRGDQRETAAANAQLSGCRISAAMIFKDVEDSVEAFEDQFGAVSLMNFADEHFSERDRRDFVAEYRQVIRQDGWFHDHQPDLNHQQFLREYRRSTLALVHAGAKAWMFLAGRGEQSLAKVHRACWIAEGLRGQTGKRSSWGLDSRIDCAEKQLTEHLADAPGLDVDEALFVLCTPTSAPLGAEGALVEDFFALRKAFPEPPGAHTVKSCNVLALSLLRRFVRRYCRWSLNDLACWYRDLAAVDHEYVARLRLARASTKSSREELVGKIGQQLGPSASRHIRLLGDQLIELNQLNLALEPAFSFKSGVGLGLWGVFALGKGTSRAPSLHLRQLDLEKAIFAGLHEPRALHQQGGQK